jgi:hypothetical protein
MAAHVYEGPGSDGQYLFRASDQDSNEGLQAQSREKGVITSKNRYLSSDTEYKVGTTINNNKAKSAVKYSVQYNNNAEPWEADIIPIRFADDGTITDPKSIRFAADKSSGYNPYDSGCLDVVSLEMSKSWNSHSRFKRSF